MHVAAIARKPRITMTAMAHLGKDESFEPGCSDPLEDPVATGEVPVLVPVEETDAPEADAASADDDDDAAAAAAAELEAMEAATESAIVVS